MMQTSYQLGDLSIERIVVGPLENNLYIVSTPTSERAVAIDAPSESPSLLDDMIDRGVDKVIITHGHHDHIGGVRDLRQRGVAVLVSEADAPSLPGYDLLIHDGDLFELGSVNFRVLSTPGHTPGSVCIVAEQVGVIFTGDTVFPGGPGATKFPGGDFPTIIASIRKMFSNYGADTLLLPGHGESTTIGAEIDSLDDWSARGW